MTNPTTTDNARDLRAVPDSTDPRAVAEAILFEVRRVIVGQDAMLERILVGLLSGGHILLEGVPGLAKTLTIKTLADVLGGSSSASSSRRTSCPPTWSARASTVRPTARSRPSSARSSRTSSSPTRSTAPRPRSSRPSSRSCRSTRSRSVASTHRSPHRSSSWPPRTRSRPRAPTRCPRPRSTGSCSRSSSATRSATEEAQIVARSLRPGLPPREILDAEGLAALQRRVDDIYVDPRIISYAVGLVEATRRLDLLGRPGARAVRRLRCQPARLDQPRPRRPRPRPPARPPLRPAVRRRRAGARRPPPPPRPVLRRPDRRHHAGRGHRAACWPSCPAPHLDLAGSGRRPGRPPTA